MGRRSSRAAPRPAPRRTASSASAPARRQASKPAPVRSSAPPPAAAKSKNAPPPAAPAQQGSAMGGFMANVASTGLGVMAGRAMDRAFFGGGSQAPVEEVAAQDEYYSSEAPEPESVCAREVAEFRKCLERTGTDMTACKWNLDILTACQQQYQENGFADASRF